jgi:hypothetical protein
LPPGSLPRALGLLTLGYGAYTLARPWSLVRVAGLDDSHAEPSRPALTLGRVVGMRDLLSGLAMVLAPPGTPLRAAVVARVACDAADVVGFGWSVPPSHRPRVVAVAGAWGLLCAASLPKTGKAR